MMQRSFLLNQVREQSERIWQDKACGLGMRLMVGFSGGSLVWLTLVSRKLPPQVPVWWSRPWGAMQLAEPVWLWLLPGSLVVINLVAVVVAGVGFRREEKLLARMVIWGAVVVSWLLTYSLINISRLVI